MNKGVIYYVGTHDFDMVKIGFTARNPEARVKSLQTGCPHQLELVAAHDGTMDDERWLHEKFSEFRVRGEWFAVSSELFQHIVQVIYLAGEACIKAKLPANDWPQWLIDGFSEIAETYSNAKAKAEVEAEPT